MCPSVDNAPTHDTSAAEYLYCVVAAILFEQSEEMWRKRQKLKKKMYKPVKCAKNYEAIKKMTAKTKKPWIANVEG